MQRDNRDAYPDPEFSEYSENSDEQSENSDEQTENAEPYDFYTGEIGIGRQYYIYPYNMAEAYGLNRAPKPRKTIPHDHKPRAARKLGF